MRHFTKKERDLLGGIQMDPDTLEGKRFMARIARIGEPFPGTVDIRLGGLSIRDYVSFLDYTEEFKS